ncbi:MAG: hypothetical protein RL267_966, partial [Chloroflexota bacterium]
AGLVAGALLLLGGVGLIARDEVTR